SIQVQRQGEVMRLVRMMVFIASFAMLFGGATWADASDLCGAAATNSSLLAKLVSRANTASTCVETVAANGIKVATPGCCAKSVCNCSVTSTGDPCTGGTPGCFSAICRGGQGGTPK